MPETIEPKHPTIEELLAVIAAQQEQIAALLARVAELERRLGLNSSNSSKPPGSEGLMKPRRGSTLREPSGKKPGAQEGHEGKTLRQTDAPDRIVDHYPEQCAGCGASLAPEAVTEFQKRQVFDLPEPQPLVVTEHRAHACRCASCGTKTQAPFPVDVTAAAQYGSRIAALVVYLQVQHHLPEDRVVDIMRDAFRIGIAAGTVGAMSMRMAAGLVGVAAVIGAQIKDAAVKHLDETGFRVGGKTLWLHVMGTLLMTFYRVSAKRGEIPPDVTGIVVHDCWKPYFTMVGVVHALCNAHLLRELKALMEFEREPWAFAMYRFLRRACHARNRAQERGIILEPRFIQLLFARYDSIVAQGLAYHEALPALDVPISTKTGQGAQPDLALPNWVGIRRRRGRRPRRIGHNLLVRMRDHRDDILRFLTDPTVPFTNNMAEQDLRMMKVKQKVSGGFRSLSGAEAFATIRTVLSTARKQGWDILASLTQSPASLIGQLRTA